MIKQDIEYKVPLEDISTLIIEDQRVSITGKLLVKLNSYNIVLFICDDKHIPSGIYTGYNTHCRRLKILKQHTELSEPFKKRCWQKIIKQKIQNQALCLQYLKKDGYNELNAVSEKVDSGDTKNIEGYAAKIYFKYLFGDRFHRRDGSTVNMALNYGYAILRGAIAREITAYGFLPAMGIHHRNELNRFNLADDFIEVYRPLVDMWVYKNIADEFEKEHRNRLCQILTYDIKIRGKKHIITNSINIMIRSFTAACRKKMYEYLKTPQMIPLSVHSYE